MLVIDLWPQRNTDTSNEKLLCVIAEIGYNVECLDIKNLKEIVLPEQGRGSKQYVVHKSMRQTLNRIYGGHVKWAKCQIVVMHCIWIACYQVNWSLLLFFFFYSIMDKCNSGNEKVCVHVLVVGKLLYKKKIKFLLTNLVLRKQIKMLNEIIGRRNWKKPKKREM